MHDYLKNIRILLILMLASGGCGSMNAEKPIWEKVKMSDLRPSVHSELPEVVKRMDVEILVFEMPAENMPIPELWEELSEQPINFRDHEVFRANSFMAGYSRIEEWDEVRQFLVDARAGLVDRVNMILIENSSDRRYLKQIEEEATIYYAGLSGRLEEVEVPKGNLLLWFSASEIPGVRGVAKLTIKPVFVPRMDFRFNLLLDEPRQDFEFEAVSFDLQMSPGDFVLLGPENYIDNQTTLGGLVFSYPHDPPFVNFYLIICREINF